MGPQSREFQIMGLRPSGFQYLSSQHRETSTHGTSARVI